VATAIDDTTCDNRVAIVTGGSRGLGRAITRRLADGGYAVVVNYAHNQRAADAAVDEVLAANGTALAVRGDVADQLDVERLFSETTEAFGGVDVVVHTVRHFILTPDPDDDLEVFDALQRTNVRGTFVVNRQASRNLRDGGAIVNLLSSVGGLPSPTFAASAASNAAIEAITAALAHELCGRDITVNGIALGLDPPSDSSDAVDIVVFLASKAGHLVNGQVIRAGGAHE